MSINVPRSPVAWWAMVLAGAAATLLFAWLGRLAGVPLATLLYVGAGGVALAWLIVLVTVPWNLYFAAHRVIGEMAVSRERGISVRADQEAEAGRIARRMLWFALGAHVGTAAVVVLTRETTHPRDDVATLKRRADRTDQAVGELRAELRRVHEDLRRAESALAGDITHARELLTADLARVQDAQEADRAAARNRDDDLGRRIDQMVRRIETALDGISDHQELLTGIRALVRMMKPDPA